MSKQPVRKYEPLTDAELAAIRERAAKASPGPWTTDVIRGGKSVLVEGPRWNGCGGWHEDTGLAPLDADFIAHARTDVPRLLAEVDRLRQDVAYLEDLRQQGYLAGDRDA